MKQYGLYRHFYTERGNRYTPTYYLGKQFADLAEAQIIGLEDSIIPEKDYTGEVSPGIITMRRFIDCTFDETKLSIEDFNGILSNVSGMNDIVLFSTVEEARKWIRENTNLIEESVGVFLIHAEYTDEMGEIIPAKYLIID